MCPFTGKRKVQHFNSKAPLDLQALIVTTVVSRHGRREQSEGMVNMRSWQGLVAVSPKFQIPACEFFRHQRIEFECRAQPGSNLFEVFYLEHRGRGAVEFEHLDCGLEDVLSRYPYFLSLESTEESDPIVTPGIILTSRLLALPLQNEASITKRSRLKEVVAGREWEQEGEMLGKVQRPIGEA